MQDQLPRSTTRLLKTPVGEALGMSNRWLAGQYCALFTKVGIVACAMYDIPTCEEFNYAIAMAKGTPQNPLAEPEDLYQAKIVKLTKRARDMGITEGMTGLEALKILLDQEAAVTA